MNKCENCRLRKESAIAFDIHWHDEVDCPYEKCPVPDFPATNADRIRAMTVEGLAETYAGGCPNGDRLNCGKYYLHGGRDCFNCWLDWLKSPVEVDNG